MQIAFARIGRFMACAAALALSGCGGGGETPQTSVGTAIFGNPQNIPTAQPVGPQPDYSCPTIDVNEGAAAYRVGGAEVSWQASIIDVARECQFGAGQFVMRIGVEGRFLLGPGGRGGTFSAPLRITVKRGDKVVAQRAARVSASISPGTGSVGFAHVEEGIGLPLSGDPGEEYEVFVGFEAAGAGRAGRR